VPWGYTYYLAIFPSFRRAWKVRASVHQRLTPLLLFVAADSGIASQRGVDLRSSFHVYASTQSSDAICGAVMLSLLCFVAGHRHQSLWPSPPPAPNGHRAAVPAEHDPPADARDRGVWLWPRAAAG
jgi:hypothetical protein